MQLMAPLVYFFEEAARWVEDAGGEANAPPTSWGWSTIAIYTCARSCSVGGGIDLGTHVVAVEWVTSIND